MSTIRKIRLWLYKQLYWKSYLRAMEFFSGAYSFEYYLSKRKYLRPIIKEWKKSK